MVVTAGKEGRQTAPARSLTAIVDFAVGTHARAVAVLRDVAGASNVGLAPMIRRPNRNRHRADHFWTRSGR